MPRRSTDDLQAGTWHLPEFSKGLPMALMRGREAVMRYFRPSLREHNLTEQQWRVLRALGQYGPLEATELARVTILLAPSLSRILRDLQVRRLVERRQVKTDLRRTVISISPSGNRLIRVITPKSEEGYIQINRRFGKRRLTALQQILQELERCLLAGLPVNGGPFAPPRSPVRVSRSRKGRPQ
jgi:homoprotocatechuate degradation regulator HpaR